MPLELYRRGKWWWIKGRIDRIPGGKYIRQSLEAPASLPEAQAREIVAGFERREIERHFLSELTGRPVAPTFAEAVLLYKAKPKEAGYLETILPHLADRPVDSIKPIEIRELCPRLYPAASTDTWRRQVIVPIQAVINNAHQHGHCPPIRVKAFDADERREQDAMRGKKSRVQKTPADAEWIAAFRKAAYLARPPDVAARVGALALFMFATGRRITQSLQINDSSDLDLGRGRVLVGGAKGHDGEWVELPDIVVADLASITPRHGRLFGWKARNDVQRTWDAVIEKGGLRPVSPHYAGRHGFGTVTTVDLGIDPKTVARAGAWSSASLVLSTYAHASPERAEVNRAIRTKLVQAGIEPAGKKLKTLKKSRK